MAFIAITGPAGLQNPFGVPPPHMLVCSPTYTHIFQKKTLEGRLSTILSYKALKYKYAEKEHVVDMRKFYEDACAAYMAEQRVRWAFRQLLTIWLKKRIDAAAEPTIDLVTLDTIHHPVYVYDMAARRRYTFEGKTFAQAIQANLFHQRDGFPQPIAPKNIFTNEAFTYAQQVSVYFQLREQGRGSWPLAYYKECDFRTEQFRTKANIPITLRALHDEIRCVDSHRGKDIIMAFIEYMVDHFEIPRRGSVLRLFEVALEEVPHHPIIEKFRMLAYADMEAQTMDSDATVILAMAAEGLLAKRWLLKKVDAVLARL